MSEPKTAHEWLEDALGRYQVTHCHSSIRNALKAMDITENAPTESAPPKPEAAQEKNRCEHGVWIADHCWQCAPSPSPAATTQPKPAPQAEGFEEHPEFPDCDCIAPADCPKNGTQKPECAESFNVWNCIGSNPSSWDDLDESDQLRWKRAMSAAQAPLLEKIAELESALRREERDSDQLMNERDEAVDVAERLSDAISKYFKTDIGEHSNLNDPFENAVEVIESRLAELESAQPNLGVERLRSRMLGLVDGFRAAQPKAEPVEKLVSDEELVRLVYEFNLQDSRQLIYESEKDGIDIEVPTHNYRLLADYLLYRQREERSGE